MSNNTVNQSSHQIPQTTQFLDNKTLSNCVETLGMANIDQAHVRFCGQIIPNCCTKHPSLESWKYSKQRLKPFKLNQPQKFVPFAP
jgi:hypothetical protein